MFFVLTVIEEDIESSVTGGPEQNTGKLGARIFILISTIMTWGNTESVVIICIIYVEILIK